MLFDSVKRIYHVIADDARRVRARIIGGGEENFFDRFLWKGSGASGEPNAL